jgi:LPXTG-motif cell wall-anchored protein
MLESTSTNQDGCQDSVLHFAFSGTAVASDSGRAVASDSGRSLAYTGADVGPAALLGGGLLVLGAILIVVARRGRRSDGDPR